MKKISAKILKYHENMLENQHLWLLKTVVLFFILGHLSFFRLWVNTRSIPLTPFFKGWPLWSYPFDYIFLFIHLILLFLLLFRKTTITLCVITVISYIHLVLQDQNRFISWGLQYFGIFLMMIFWIYENKRDIKKKDNSQRADYTIFACKCIITAVYFWGGINKLNYRYINEVFPWFAQPILGLSFWKPFFYDKMSGLPTMALKVMAGLSILIEVSIAFGLWFEKTKKAFVGLVAFLHLTILYCLSPMGLSWGYSVMSWNVSMIFFSYIIFIPPAKFKALPFIFARESIILTTIIFIYLVLPFANLFDLWPTHLSFCMYSGSTKVAKFYIHQKMKPKIPHSYDPYLTKVESSSYFSYNYFMMSYDECGYSGIPEAYQYRKNKEYLCRFVGNDERFRPYKIKTLQDYPILLMIQWRPNILSGKRKYTLEDCDGNILKRGEM